MQKKVIMIIIGYILLISVFAAGLFLKRQFDNIPVLDDALIQELLAGVEGIEFEKKDRETSAREEEEINTEKEGNGINYWENYHQEKELSENNRDPVISQIQKQISAADKLRIMKIVKDNLSNEEIQRIISLTKNGLTDAEQAEVKSILQNKIGEEEKEELKALLLKYL